MQKRSHKTTSPEMLKAQEKFRYWRKTRKTRKPIPKDLWQVAVNLSDKHSVNQIAKGLSLSYSDLKKRILKSSDKSITAPSFVEFDLQPPMQQPSECIVELSDGNGAHMKMHFKGDASLDLLELGRTFLGKNR